MPKALRSPAFWGVVIAVSLIVAWGASRFGWGQLGTICGISQISDLPQSASEEDEHIEWDTE